MKRGSWFGNALRMNLRFRGTRFLVLHRVIWFAFIQMNMKRDVVRTSAQFEFESAASCSKRGQAPDCGEVVIFNKKELNFIEYILPVFHQEQRPKTKSL